MMRQAIKALLRLEKNIDNQLNFERFIRRRGGVPVQRNLCR